MTRFELVTFPLPRGCATSAPHGQTIWTFRKALPLRTIKEPRPLREEGPSKPCGRNDY
jgi:hypothetical protein